MVHLASQSRNRKERGCRLRASSSVLGRHVDRQFARLSAARLCRSPAGIPRQADRHRRGGLAVGGPHEEGSGAVPRERSLVHARLRPARDGEGLRLLSHGGLRPAIEDQCGRPGGRVLGPFRCQQQSEIRLYRTAPVLPRMADLRARRGDPDAVAGSSDPRPDAARAPAGLYCDGRVDRAGLNRPAGRDRRHDPRIYRRRRSVDDLRHGAARHTGLCRDPDRRHRTRRQPVARGAAQRTVGDPRDQPARVGSRSLLQRTAGHGDGDARSSGEAGL